MKERTFWSELDIFTQSSLLKGIIRLNFESNAFIYDRDVTGRMNAQFEEDMKHSTEYTQEDRDNISLYERLAESISRLLTEIL